MDVALLQKNESAYKATGFSCVIQQSLTAHESWYYTMEYSISEVECVLLIILMICTQSLVSSNNANAQCILLTKLQHSGFC